MRFLDANIPVYAILKPKEALSEQMKRRKGHANDIFTRVDAGEEVLTTVVHLSEVANILEDAKSLPVSIRFVTSMVRKENVEVQPVTPKEYLLASSVANEKEISLNDGLAVVKMEHESIEEIYSFDTHFDKTDKKRITK